MAEAIEAVELGFKEWADNREFNQPRRRVHAPSGVRVSVHQGTSPQSGMTGLVALGLRIRQTTDTQKAERHAEPVYTLFDADSGDLASVVIGDITPAELPDDPVMAGCPHGRGKRGWHECAGARGRDDAWSDRRREAGALSPFGLRRDPQADAHQDVPARCRTARAPLQGK